VLTVLHCPPFICENLAEGCIRPHGRNLKSQSYDRKLLAENHHSWWKWATAPPTCSFCKKLLLSYHPKNTAIK
jgi:hypothetical protein